MGAGLWCAGSGQFTLLLGECQSLAALSRLDAGGGIAGQGLLAGTPCRRLRRELALTPVGSAVHCSWRLSC